MKILIATHHLLDFAGSEIYTYVLAKTLSDLGHRPTVYSKYVGKLRKLFEDYNVEIIENLELVKNEKFEVAHVQHNITAFEVRNYFPDIPIVYVVHGVTPFLEQLPFMNLNIDQFIAVSDGVKKKLIQDGIPNNKIKVIRNLIMTNEFKSQKAINKVPLTALVLSSKLTSDKENVLRKAFENLDIKARFVGRKYGFIDNRKLYKEINKADLVVTIGRGAVEAMLSERVVLAYDHLGSDGIVTQNNYRKLIKNSFNGSTKKIQFTPSELEEEIRLKYSKVNTKKLRNLAVNDFDSMKNTIELLNIYEELAKVKEKSSLDQYSLSFVFQMIVETRHYTKYQLEQQIQSTTAHNKNLIKQLELYKNENAALKSYNKNIEIILSNIKSSKTFKAWQAYVKFKKFVLVLIMNPSKITKNAYLLIKPGGIKLILNKSLGVIKRGTSKQNINQQYKVWFDKHYPSKNKLVEQRTESSKFQFQPKISIITPLYKTKHQHLKEMIESVREQSYDNWELCIADDASNDVQLMKLLDKYSKLDSRIKFTIRESNGHICKASNTALTLATGEYVALLDHDDILWPNALFENVKLLNADKSADLIYSDEDKLEEDGVTHVDPFFKPDWSPSYLRSLNYITHFAVIKKNIVDQLNGFRSGFEGAQDWDLFLRVSNQTNKIRHIPTILYSWRKSSTSTASEKYVANVKNYAYENQAKALKADLEYRKVQGKVLKTNYLGLWRVKNDLIEKPLVSIIIPTKDKYEYISKLLKSIDEKTTYKNYELLIVDTGSEDEKVFSLYNKYKDKLNIRVLKWDKKFNFAAVSNYGAKNSRGKYLLFLNNDTEIISPDWIESMLEHAQHADIGAVGAKLLYPDKTIQHAGVVLGIGGVANHAYQHVSDLGPATFPMMYAKDAVREVSAVTGACLLCKKKVFNEVGGFDENFRIAYNDVDFCLKLLDKGYRNIYTPFARLYHHENVSVGNPFKGTRDNDEFWHENEMMYKKWDNLIRDDTYYNENITKSKTDFSIGI